jgi:glycosyltransferase involved in cell wall biosynthesis
MHVTLYKAGKVPIPPVGYGGAERFIYWLGKTLIELGHQVTLIANAQSHIPGAELRAIYDNDAQSWQRLIPDSTDIVHLWDLSHVPLTKPYLLSVGGNGRPREKFPLNTVFVSRSHAANHGSRHFVYSGVIPEDYSCSEKREDYAVFLAKARWKVKNLEGAISVARRAEIELRVIGSRNWPLNLHRLLPTFCGVRYCGEVDESEKRDLLSRARCLIFPVRWHEPFGIANIEALASGAFVLGTPYGSLPEIITPETGVLSAKAGELADAAKNPQRFSPQRCREHILNNGFTHLDMARKYLEFYGQVLARGSLIGTNEAAPATQPGFVAKQLLPWEN